jgi:hypothetical protein
MDPVRAIGPFVLGLLLPPVTMIPMRGNWSGGAKFALSFATALVISVAIALVGGDIAQGLPGAVVAILVYTSLVFTGSQLAYWSFWRPVLEPRRREKLAHERVAQRRR